MESTKRASMLRRRDYSQCVRHDIQPTCIDESPIGCHEKGHRSAPFQVSIADTGRGMPPEVLESLFTARAISRKPGGTGLGTKIIKDVVDAHRGQITVRSEEGAGTTFTLLLPVHQAER